MRALLFILTAFVLVLLQGSVLQLLPLRTPAPALGLLVALHVGLSPRWSLSGAVVVSFASGYLFDLVAGAPRGAHALVYILVCLMSAFWAQRLSLRGGVLQKAVAGFGVALLAALLLLLVRLAVAPEGGRPGFAGLRLAPLEALLTAVVAPLVLRLFERIEGRVGPGRGASLRDRHPRTLQV